MTMHYTPREKRNDNHAGVYICTMRVRVGTDNERQL